MSIELDTLVELRNSVFKELEQVEKEGYVVGMSVDERRIWVESRDHINNRISDLDKQIKIQRKIDEENKRREKDNEIGIQR